MKFRVKHCKTDHHHCFSFDYRFVVCGLVSEEPNLNFFHGRDQCKPCSNIGGDPFNQNSDRSDWENWSTSKGGPIFSKLFRLDRTDPLSSEFGPKFPEILVEWIAPIMYFFFLNSYIANVNIQFLLSIPFEDLKIFREVILDRWSYL